jgi:hypothetical protein
MMEAASTSETSVNFYQTTHGATTLKTAVFRQADVWVFFLLDILL